MVRTAVMGATGAVGREIVKILEERNFPASTIKFLASERSLGKTIPYKGKEIAVELLTKDSFKDIDLVLSSPGASVSKIFSPEAVKSGAVVVDNTSAYRMEKDVPLVVPEVNPEDIRKHKGIISNPNCSTIQMVVALKPIYDAVGIKRLVISTYQAVSGTGKAAIDELDNQVRQYANNQPMTNTVYPYQIAFNCLPHIDVFLENGYTKEEMKMVNETRKIMGDDNIAVTATTVRVPVFRAHSESVNVETRKKITAQEVKDLLSKAPGVIVVDDTACKKYPLAIDAANKDATYVGRIREDESIENGINLWIVSDNLRKGAALNAVQIAEKMIEMGLLK